MIPTRFAAVLAAPFLLLFATSSQADTGQLDGSPSLFAVMAAINAAGYDAGLESAANNPLRQQIRQHLAQKHIACLAELKRFFKAHAQGDPSAELSQYVSFALSVEGPPDFNYRFQANEIPPDVRALAGFEELMAKFYREAEIESLWTKVQPAYDQAIAAYQAPVTQAVLEANAFLRNPTSGYLGRRFQIYLDLLGAPNQIHTRSYRDDYFVVLTPSAEPKIEEIRHAYLHYLLDPLSFKYAGSVFRNRGLIDYVQAAPALDQGYKDDISLMMTESLIKAIEARLTRGGPAKQQAVVDQALREGYVGAPALYEILAGFQKQEKAMRLYYPEMMEAIDLKKEARRLDKVEFAKERMTKLVKAPAPVKVEPTPGEKTLDQAQLYYQEKKLDQAREAYLGVLKNTGEKSLHAQAYYGLARIAALQRDPEMAEQLFRKALESGPDAETRSWSFIYLARLSDAQGHREQATENYQAALSVQGASDKARDAAEKGLKESFKGK